MFQDCCKLHFVSLKLKKTVKLVEIANMVEILEIVKKKVRKIEQKKNGEWMQNVLVVASNGYVIG